MNVLVDTSIWIDHIKKPFEPLVFLLNNGQVLAHKWITGELALGTFKEREAFLRNLNLLPLAPELSIDELLNFIEINSLRGMGIGLVDIQILASAKLSDAAILTRDKALQVAMAKLKILSA